MPERRPDLGPCHLWTAAEDKDGYGVFGMPGENGKWVMRRAARVAFFLEHGVWPVAHACHHCDNPPCVNAGHVFDGDDLANVRDMQAKGREPRGATHGMRLHPEAAARGEAHGQSKLTSEDVLEIRALLATAVSRSSIGRRYGVCLATISNIANRKVWGWLP